MNRLSLQGKVALVTGASGGIGRAIAERLSRDGASVVVNYYPSARQDAEEVVRGIVQSGGKAIAAGADIADSTQMRGQFDLAEMEFGHVDIGHRCAQRCKRETRVHCRHDGRTIR